MASTLFVVGIGKAFQFLAGLAPALSGQLHLTGKVRGASVFIEQAAVRIGLEQRLMLMLTVDINDQFAQGFEVAERAGCAIDIASRTPFGSDDPSQDARAVALQITLGEPGAGFRDVDQIERSKDVCLVRAWTDHAAVGTVAERQAQCVEHDRLAGAGFTRDHAHPAIKFEIEMFDDGVVVYGQVHQHKGRSQA